MIPGLPQGDRSKVYQRIVEQLKTDPVLSSVVSHWNTWEGTVDETVLAENPGEVALQLTPRLGPTEWANPSAHRGALLIQVELWLPGGGLGVLSAADSLDLWESVENAIYPYRQQSKRQAFEQQLRDLGAVTGQLIFSQPASIAAVDKSGFYLIGNMSLDIQRQFDA
jgi:hypothetical protein